MRDNKRFKGGRYKKEKFLPYTRENYILFTVALVLIVLGYFALSRPPWNSFMSLNVAPILLVLGYCVIIPIALLYQKKKPKPAEEKPFATPAAQQTTNP